jgi:SAM-dependent methyltransferase
MHLNSLPIILPDIYLLANVPSCKKTPIISNKKISPALSNEDKMEQKIIRESRKQQKLKRRGKRYDMLASFFAGIPAPGGSDVATYYKKYSAPQASDIVTTSDYLEGKGSVDWSSVPRSVDPGFNYVLDSPLGDNPDLELRHEQQLLQLHNISMNSTDEPSPSTIRSATDIVGRSSALIKTSGQYNGFTTRAVRKRAQTESFVLILRPLLAMLDTFWREAPRDQPCHIVDFGSGSGNLCLALAFLFPSCSFTAVDFKAKSIEILNQRAAAADLKNIRGIVGKIEDFDKPFDIALALHACGVATDFALQQAKRCRAAYAVCPCCVGNLKYAPPIPPLADTPEHHVVNDHCEALESPCGEDDGVACISEDRVRQNLYATRDLNLDITAVSHPRSMWLDKLLSTNVDDAADVYTALARAGDIAHGSAHSSTQGVSHTHEAVARLCKSHLELDRNMHMAEADYSTALMQILLSELTGKGDLLVGVPEEWTTSVGVSDGVLPWSI